MTYRLEAYKVLQIKENNISNLLQSKIDLGTYNDLGELEKARLKHQKETFNGYEYWVEGSSEQVL